MNLQIIGKDCKMRSARICWFDGLAFSRHGINYKCIGLQNFNCRTGGKVWDFGVDGRIILKGP
jgi:hypothetical protein